MFKMNPLLFFITAVVLGLGLHKTLDGTTSHASNVAVMATNVSLIFDWAWISFELLLHFKPYMCIIAIILYIAAVLTIVGIYYEIES